MFNEPWEEYKISDLFKITRGYVLSTNMISNIKTFKMRYPVYSSQTKENGLLGYYSDYLYENAITWTTDGANAGTVNYRKGKFYCTNVCGVLISDKVKADLMISEVLNKIAKNYVLKAGNPKLMNNVMADIKIKIPSNAKERNKISIFYTILNKEIDLYENKIILLNKYKRGLFYHVFLKYDKYKQTKIADLICKYETDVNCKNYLEISDIDIKTNTYKIDINKLAVNGSKKGYQGNIIISTVRPNRGAITILKDNIYISSGFCQLHINNDISNTNFIYQVKKNKKILNKMQLLTTGTTYPTISQNDILNISIPVPSLEEQNKIANILSTYDNLIDKEKQVLNLLQEMKSGLLQQMFI